jgi:uncharacterized RDD family membrane protein YckC
MNSAELASTYGFGIIARRWLATWIDFVVLALFLLVPDYVLGNELYRKTIFVWLALAIAYFPTLETLYGRSLGKFVSGIVVVDANGRTPSLGQSIVRTVLRLVEVNPFLLGGLPAGVAAIATRSKQRLGDMLARTYVITTAHYRQSQTAMLTSQGTAASRPVYNV